MSTPKENLQALIKEYEKKFPNEKTTIEKLKRLQTEIDETTNNDAIAYKLNQQVIDYEDEQLCQMAVKYDFVSAELYANANENIVQLIQETQLKELMSLMKQADVYIVNTVTDVIETFRCKLDELVKDTPTGDSEELCYDFCYDAYRLQSDILLIGDTFRTMAELREALFINRHELVEKLKQYLNEQNKLKRLS